MLFGEEYNSFISVLQFFHYHHHHHHRRRRRRRFNFSLTGTIS